MKYWRGFFPDDPSMFWNISVQLKMLDIKSVSRVIPLFFPHFAYIPLIFQHVFDAKKAGSHRFCGTNNVVNCVSRKWVVLSMAPRHYMCVHFGQSLYNYHKWCACISPTPKYNVIIINSNNRLSLCFIPFGLELVIRATESIIPSWK